jgi:hypothetical protein
LRWQAKQARGQVRDLRLEEEGEQWHCARHQKRNAKLAAEYRDRHREKVLAFPRARAA